MKYLHVDTGLGFLSPQAKNDHEPYVIAAMILCAVFLFFWFPFVTRRIDPWFRLRLGQYLGCTIGVGHGSGTRAGTWEVVERGVGRKALVTLFHLLFIGLFWFGPCLLMGAAFLAYNWPGLISHR